MPYARHKVRGIDLGGEKNQATHRAGWSVVPLGALWSSPFGSSATTGVSRPLPARGPRQLLAVVLAVGGIGGESANVAERLRRATGYRGPAPWHGTSGRSGRLLIGYAGLRSVTALEIEGRALGQMPGLWLRRVSAPALPRRDTSGCRRPHRVACASVTSTALRRTSRRSGGSGRSAWVAPARRGLLRGSPHPCMAHEAHAPASPVRAVGGSMTDEQGEDVTIGCCWRL